MDWEAKFHQQYGDHLKAGSVRVLESQRRGKGRMDIRHEFSGEGGPGTSMVRLQGETASGQWGSVSGIVSRLVHNGQGDIGQGFNIVYSALHNAKDWSPPDEKNAALLCFFGNTISPLHTDSWQIATMELNATNIRGDKGERLRAADFDPGKIAGGGVSRIVVLKPESRYGSFSDKGYPIDMYVVAGPDNHDDELVGAYAGIVLKNDAIQEYGVGMRFGGRTSTFDNPPPDAAIRVDHQWKRGIDFRHAEFTEKAALELAEGQRIRWDTSGGAVVIWGWRGGLYGWTRESGWKRLL